MWISPGASARNGGDLGEGKGFGYTVNVPVYPQYGDIEYTFINGHVGVKASIAQLREKPLDTLIEEAKAGGKILMIHPDDKGCVFLQKRNGKYGCNIYHHRPRSCRGFRCNMADNTFLDVFGQDAPVLLGMDPFGLP